MQLKSQVTSLEISKLLEKLGVKQNSIFVWEYHDDTCYSVKFRPFAVVPIDLNHFKIYSAFTVSELGEMLPTIMNDGELFCTFYKQFKVGYGECGDYDIFTVGETEADARGKMLIHLIENGLMQVPK